MEKVLIINAHLRYEGISEGRLNQSFVNLAEETLTAKGCEVRITQVEKGFDLAEEAAKHHWADLVITQTPVYWFGSPWIHRRYIEEVFNVIWDQGKLGKDDGRSRTDPGKQYGTGGLSLGKKYLLSTTWNAPKEAFGDEKQFLFEGRSADDALIGLSATYKFCGFEILKGFHCYDVIKRPQIEKDMETYKAYLERIIDAEN